MTTRTNRNKLSRFTTLPVLLDMIIKKHLVFSDWKLWEDKNDTELLKIYRERRTAKKVLVLCFLKEHETIHHWKAFADGMCGCCIEFNKKMLISLLSALKKKGENLSFGPIVYQKLKDVCDGSVGDCAEMIPFKKRWPYRYEKEFRVIWEGSEDSYKITDVDLAMITKITFSPIMPNPLFETLKNYLRNGGLGISAETIINLSTVYKNKCWIGKFRKRFGNNGNSF